MESNGQKKNLENGQDIIINKGQEPISTTALASETPGNKFSPHDLSIAPKIPSNLPPELWTIVQSAPANFPPQYFLDVSRNLLENPNLTASHLARAELSYQSFADATFNPKAKTSEDLASIVKHLRPKCRPHLVEGGIDGYDLEWTVVRKLIPRNPKLDESLMQTCHLFTSTNEITITTDEGVEETVHAERYLVIYIPHVTNPDEIPFYHPTVRSLGILYTYFPSHTPSSTFPSPGTLSIYFDFFPSHPQDNRLTRTALKLLEIIHKHSKGRQAGYKKRVHHDQIIPQKRFQDTYAYLKGKYAKTLIEGWVEQTPPEKHVFEDLGIAAFLIELWNNMYSTDKEVTHEEKEHSAKKTFPGFVDIGCGNGLLVYILNAEGWTGWGFDARRRKTWNTFGPEYTDKLEEMLLIPQILCTTSSPSSDETPLLNAPPSHTGVFPHKTFIISNHADELTPWTPLLAHLSDSPFIAIPCCSHDLGGARFRSPVHRKYVLEDPNATGKEKNKQPSAYAGLCSWVSHLTETMGYKVEKEHLRIPSTRNIAILGRIRPGEVDGENSLEKLDFAREVVEKEMGGTTTVEQVRLMWMKSGGELVKPGKGGH
jgi:tRNASer (uridine44-2'-O)-methyltransferase